MSTGSPGSTAVVQDAVAFSGSQSVRVERGPGSRGFWADLLETPPSGRFVTVDWAMLVEPTPASGGFGPFFGVNIFDDNNRAPLLVASLGVDATTGDILVQEQGTGFLVETGVQVVFNQWNTFRLDLDLATGLYDVTVQGIEILSDLGFVDSGVRTVTDADIAAFAVGNGVSDQLAGVAYVDEFLVRQGPPGDYNGSGTVDVADYTLWRDQLGQASFGLSADGNLDGVVDLLDYQLWVDAFGDTNDLPAVAAAVPEPGSAVAIGAVLLAASAPGATRTARRQSCRGASAG